MLYPIYLNIGNKLVAIIGGGEVAFRKAKDLIEAGARVRIISPTIHEGIIELKNSNIESINLIQREYSQGDLEGAILVFAATNDQNINRQVFNEAEGKNIFINSVDDPPNCSFFVPSMVRRGDFILSVSTSGASPAMAAKLRRLFEEDIPHNIEDILKSLREARLTLQEIEGLNPTERGAVLKNIVNDDNLLTNIVEYSKKNKMKEFIQMLI
ncbi:MAG: bifunctional precorrin-2 dehydrogenase/sirohydrochlorin ferrochelatase [Spirochaetota bacterium]|nr:bifunctional precorrin-2 dehydrogenase/sirohydrochlorin ferrochelatase [Spirochaetota bacterium]